tara:strand:+ start:780 stop:911 length:132 start_codon:yes stop_codon:yes gene_type:complete
MIKAIRAFSDAICITIAIHKRASYMYYHGNTVGNYGKRNKKEI